MEKEESVLKKYHLEVTGLLTEMNKDEAIEFFSKYQFEKDDVYITTASGEDMEIISEFDEIDDETLDEFDDIIENNEIEYSSDIIVDIKDLDDDTNIYVTLDDNNYNYIYVQMMKERIFSNDCINKYEVFAELCDSYLEYLKIPISEKKDKLNTFEIFESFAHSLNIFIDEFVNNSLFSNMVLLSYNDLMRYYTKLEVKKLQEDYTPNSKISTINDIIRNELMEKYTTLIQEENNQYTAIKKMYSELINNNNYNASCFDEKEKQPICTNDYVKLLIINDAYLMSRIGHPNEFKTNVGMGIILDTFNTLNQRELVNLFNTNPNFGPKCCRFFVEFNTMSNYNISKSTLKKTYGDKKILQKINKYHFLDYVSND